MANHPKLLLVPATFLDDFETLLGTAPPPKTARDRADRATAKRIIKRARKRRVEVLDEKALRARAREKAR
jgi:hypothetical protein